MTTVVGVASQRLYKWAVGRMASDVERRLEGLHQDVAVVKDRLLPNGGGSLADDVAQLKKDVAAINLRLDGWTPGDPDRRKRP